MAKLTKITMIVFILYIVLGLTSCVTKKKLKESQELQTIYLLDQTETKFVNSINTLESKISNSLSLDFDEKLKLIKESTLTNENETTSITGTLPTSDKETSVTIGNTVIKNNGGNVSFDIKSSKQLTSQLETLNKELTQSLNEVQTSLKTAKNEFIEYIKEQNQINESLKAQLDKQSKETDKKGLNLWVWIILVVSALLVLFWFFGGKIPIVAKVKSFLKV